MQISFHLSFIMYIGTQQPTSAAYLLIVKSGKRILYIFLYP